MSTLKCGTQVNLELKNGTKMTVDISEIYKGNNEKVLAETFDEPFHFPV